MFAHSILLSVGKHVYKQHLQVSSQAANSKEEAPVEKDLWSYRMLWSGAPLQGAWALLLRSLSASQVAKGRSPQAKECKAGSREGDLLFQSEGIWYLLISLMDLICSALLSIVQHHSALQRNQGRGESRPLSGVACFGHWCWNSLDTGRLDCSSSFCLQDQFDFLNAVEQLFGLWAWDMPTHDFGCWCIIETRGHAHSSWAIQVVIAVHTGYRGAIETNLCGKWCGLVLHYCDHFWWHCFERRLYSFNLLSFDFHRVCQRHSQSSLVLEVLLRRHVHQGLSLTLLAKMRSNTQDIMYRCTVVICWQNAVWN